MSKTKTHYWDVLVEQEDARESNNRFLDEIVGAMSQADYVRIHDKYKAVMKLDYPAIGVGMDKKCLYIGGGQSYTFDEVTSLVMANKIKFYFLNELPI